MLGGDEEFSVALGTLDWAFSVADHAPVRERTEPAGDAIADLGVMRGISDHAALAYAAAPDLELGLDQRHQNCTRRRERKRRWQHYLETDEARVANHEPNRLGHVLGCQITRVEAFEHDYAPVLTEPPVELTASNIDGVDTRRAALQQHVGEPARRSADVEANTVVRVEVELIESIRQLDTASRDPRMGLTAHLDICVLGDRGPGLVEPLVIGKDSAGAD